MKTKTVQFFFIKFIVFNIVNLIAFGAGYLIDTLSGFFFTQEQAFAQTALVCCVSFCIFCAYVYLSTAGMKESTLPPAVFVIREALAYMIFMIVPTVGVLLPDAGAIGTTPLTRFYLPNLTGTHLTGLPILGFLLQTLIVTAVIFAAHAANRKKWAAYHAEEERKRAEDEAYAEQLMANEQENG